MKILERSRRRRIEMRSRDIHTPSQGLVVSSRLRNFAFLHPQLHQRELHSIEISSLSGPLIISTNLGRQVKSTISCWVHRECAVLLPHTSFLHNEDEPTNYILDPFYIAQCFFFSIIASTLDPQLSLPR